mmetsp:Transcript_6348/g.11779  ORF Transcript_6348/g.11779 Transcript_6348/m.11779 type:complete len:363 (+) Transcript_6348:74-1162(+)
MWRVTVWHLICGSCLNGIECQDRESSRRCPVCRISFTGPRIRNLFAEQKLTKRRRITANMALHLTEVGINDAVLPSPVGTWHYITPTSGCASTYRIETDVAGKMRVSGTLADGICSSGLLERHGDWYQGDVRFGLVRFRREGPHLLSNLCVSGTTIWGPTVQAHQCGLIGNWYYTVPNTGLVSCYRIGLDEYGCIRLSESLADGSLNSGILEKREEWYEGDIGHGFVRLRLDGQSIHCNFRTDSGNDWGPDIKGHRCGVLGTWSFIAPDSNGTVATLVIEMDTCGHVRVLQTCAQCEPSAGILEQHGDWHHGSLGHREVRMRRDGQHLLLQQRTRDSASWGEEVQAHRLALPPSDGIVCICD